MGSLRDTVAYVCKHYPDKDELSNARVTKMVYLADWKAAIDQGEQLTNITWRFEHFGPFVYDVRDMVVDDPDFEIVPTRNMYGAHKELLRVSERVHEFPFLTEDDQKILDFVITTSSKLNWSEFIRLV